MSIARQHYSQEYDSQVQEGTTSQPCNWVVIDKTPLAATTDTSAAQFKQSTCDRLTLSGPKLIHVKENASHSLVIAKHGIDNVILTDHTAPALLTDHSNLIDNLRSHQDYKKKTRLAQDSNVTKYAQL